MSAVDGFALRFLAADNFLAGRRDNDIGYPNNNNNNNALAAVRHFLRMDYDNTVVAPRQFDENYCITRI